MKTKEERMKRREELKAKVLKDWLDDCDPYSIDELERRHKPCVYYSVEKAFDAASEMDREELAAKDARIAYLESGFVHTCRDECQKPLCVKFREKDKRIADLEAKLKIGVEALRRIQSPDHKGIDGMIIADMGLKHFTQYTAEKAIAAIHAHRNKKGEV